MAMTDAERRRLRLLLFALAGALAGHLLHRAVGCPSGGCLITGNPWVATLYGAAVAVVLGLGFVPPPRR